MSRVGTTLEVHGHRGARGLRPENTLPGFACALELGVDAIELDVGRSADDVAVLNHDAEISRRTCRDTAPLFPGDPLFPYVGRALRELTLAQLKTLDAGRPVATAELAATLRPAPGTPVATLAEVCELLDAYAAGEVLLCVELKTDPSWSGGDVEELTALVVATLDAYGRTGRSRLLGFDWRVLAAAARLAPDATRVALVEEKTVGADAARWFGGIDPAGFGGDLAAAAAAAGASMLSPDADILTTELLASASAYGLPVTVWTVNEPAEMDRLVDAGVAAIVTDYPDRLRAVLAERGLPLPPALDPPALDPPAVTASGCGESPGTAAGRPPR